MQVYIEWTIADSGMRIRTAHIEDKPAIAALCAVAFCQEDCFCRVILPKYRKFPDDVRIYWHEWLRADWQEKDKVILVAIARYEEQDALRGCSEEQESNGSDSINKDAGEKVVGVAVWQRKGDDEHAR